MLDGLLGPHLDNLQTALDRTAQRHALLTGNVANVNVPGYKRKDMDFNIVLKEEMEKNPFAERSQDLRDQMAQRASDRTSIRLDGNNVDIEREVMSLAETQLRYEALTKSTSSYLAGIKNAIREGK